MAASINVRYVLGLIVSLVVCVSWAQVPAAYQSAGLGGFGITQVPQLGIRDLLASGELVAVLPDYQAPPLDVSLLYAGQRHLPLRVRVFMEWLAATLQARI